MNLILILGNQLFNPSEFPKLGVSKRNSIFFMKEDRELATYFKFHKHKIIFFFAAMRAYRDELNKLGYKVQYHEYGDDELSYEQSVKKAIKDHSIQSVSCFEIEDKFFEKRIIELFQSISLELEFWQSPMFLTSREAFKKYLDSHRRPFMKTFYESQRKRLNILMKNGQPVGGAWSFDTENRLALPKDKKTPSLPAVKLSKLTEEVMRLVDNEFADHPGKVQDFWLPVDRKGAQVWLKSFLEERLVEFGPYEDAIPASSDFLYHSVLTPFLNCGLLTPEEVVGQTLDYGIKVKVPLASLEGFLRQVIGWREFIRGIYQNFDDRQQHSNFWNHKNHLTSVWYEGNTGIPPLDETIRRVLQRGYAHHIERLMVVGSLMVLLEVHPKEAHKWFMEMFIDSSDWVMGPNVYGMALFSDGGIFATKPYICGSNYLRKMGGYKKGDWCDAVDGLYWSFIKKHEDFFMKNPRLSMMARSAQKIPEARWKILSSAARELRKKLVIPAGA